MISSVVFTQYEDPSLLHSNAIEKPVPKGNKFLVKVFALPVTAGAVPVRKAAYPDTRICTFITRLYFFLFMPDLPILDFEL